MRYINLHFTYLLTYFHLIFTPNNHHCSDVVYWRRWHSSKFGWVLRKQTVWLMLHLFCVVILHLLRTHTHTPVWRLFSMWIWVTGCLLTVWCRCPSRCQSLTHAFCTNKQTPEGRDMTRFISNTPSEIQHRNT